MRRLNRESVDKAAQQIIGQFGKVDCLINGAGGNNAAATTRPDFKFFDLPADALRLVFDLNILGTILPCQAFGKSWPSRATAPSSTSPR